ncbi:MAG: YIP1 family protein [Candidatus Micrarchaeota archaeon]|nr:YIP1 family protein [Candidatus Micrarchaeota archaeon]
MFNISEYFYLLKDLFTKPAETVKKLKRKNYGFSHSLPNILIPVIFFTIFSFLSFLSQLDFSGAVITLFLSPVLGLIGFSLGILISSAIFIFLAKVLGGKEVKLQTFFYILSLFYSPFTILNSFFLFLTSIPLIGLIFAVFTFLGSLVLCLIGLYFLTIIIRETFELSTLRAIAVWFLPTIVLIFLAILVGLIVGAVLGIALLSLLLKLSTIS